MAVPGNPPLPLSPFRWRDGERLIVFGPRTLDDVPDLLEPVYTLLTTERAAALAARLVAGAAAVHHVPAGRVDELAAELRPEVEGELLVALGGGRVIDVAKALAAADPPRRVAAIPTTLSAAEMTGIHRHATGIAFEAPRVRPALVVNDPLVCASQPDSELAASALNALGHAAEAPLTPAASPLPTLAALEAARLIAHAWERGDPYRDALALGALLSGYAVGAAGYGLHHVLSQTLVRFTPAGHGPANAVMLPHSLRALARRSADEVARLGEALGGDPTSVAAALCARAGATRLRELGVTGDQLVECADAAAQRPELHATPPAADRDEILGLYETAW